MSGKSSYMMCLKYRIILLIVIKNPWVQFPTHMFFLLRGAAPYPAGALTAPLRHPAGLLATFGGFDIPTFKISLSFLITAWQLCIYRFAV